MTNEEIIEEFKRQQSLCIIENEWYKVLGSAIKSIEDNTRLKKAMGNIKEDIQKLRGCSCSCSDGIIDDVEDVIDKYTEGLL